MKKSILWMLFLALLVSALAGCSGAPSPSSSGPGQSQSRSDPGQSQSAGGGDAASDAGEAPLPDGVYDAEFDTDSSMFRVNETCGGKGVLTVKDGRMTIHVSLLSKKILNLYPGTAVQAQEPGAVWLEPSVDTVTYPDGITEEVYGFDVPVPAVGEEFDLALLGAKGAWYDHKVSVKNPEPRPKAPGAPALSDGSYRCDATLQGGSGRAAIENPVILTAEGGRVTARIVWDSSNYDYMVVDGERYLPVSAQGNSAFLIPVAGFDAPLPVTADTVAMSVPHEISYTLTFSSKSLEPVAK